MSTLVKADNILVQIDDYKFTDLSIKEFSLSFKSPTRSLSELPPPAQYNVSPTPYRISTITILSGISSRVDLFILYKNVRVFPIGKILNVRYFDQPTRGLFKIRQVKKSKVNKQIFLNQITFDILLTSSQIISTKLFKDGKIQMAGCKKKDDAFQALKILTSEIVNYSEIIAPGSSELRCSQWEYDNLTNLYDSHQHQQLRDKLQEYRMRRIKMSELNMFPVFKIDFIRKGIESLAKIESPEDLEIVMINSDFDAKVQLDKEKLVNVLRSIYGLHCRPSSSRYPGINAKYISNATCKNGCTTMVQKKKCSDTRKRRKSAEGCVTVSILAFAQGKVIITGARAIEQLDETYEFITKVFRNNYQHFSKVAQ